MCRSASTGVTCPLKALWNNVVVLWLYRLPWPVVCRAVSISTSLNQCVPPCCSGEMPPRSPWGPKTRLELKVRFSWSPCPYGCHRSVWTPAAFLSKNSFQLFSKSQVITVFMELLYSFRDTVVFGALFSRSSYGCAAAMFKTELNLYTDHDVQNLNSSHKTMQWRNWQ